MKIKHLIQYRLKNTGVHPQYLDSDSGVSVSVFPDLDCVEYLLRCTKSLSLHIVPGSFNALQLFNTSRLVNTELYYVYSNKPIQHFQFKQANSALRIKRVLLVARLCTETFTRRLITPKFT